ncbi:hypothetical protein LSH36_887g01012 [Paralvinella palmiformis]|uniref:Uncharacterized protein n=1 Tax=Paralvinella palmiformis TaxID=53620 RepID=A0AAD9IY29_9ANNE|nr:hypothetical protein LSH36_887g01012 [Paralvinella palmiformis]
MITMLLFVVIMMITVTIAALGLPLGGAVQNACYLNNGYCRYQVNIVSECDADAESGPQQQDDGYYGGPNAIEKYLLQAKSEQSERLAVLESKLNKYLKYSPEQAKSKQKGTEKPTEVTAANEVLSKVKKRKRSHDGAGFRRDPARKENTLLNRIHKEFTILRQQLADVQQKLHDTEKSLFATTEKLNESEAENRKLSHQLRHTEGKLEEEQAKSYRYRKALENKESQLNSTKTKLKNTQTELRRLRLENWKLKAENEDYKALLEQCLVEKETLRKALEQALIKYHELNLKHENITLQLNETQEELVICYKVDLYVTFVTLSGRGRDDADMVDTT